VNPQVSSASGVILNVYESGDSDLVVHILAEGVGKIALIAKGARRSKKRFAGGLDIFDSGRFEYREGRGSLPLLLSFAPRNALSRIRREMARLSAASLVAECFDLLIKEGNESGRDAVEVLLLGLRSIEEAEGRHATLRGVHLTLHQLLAITGFGVLDQTLPEHSKNLSTKQFNAVLYEVEHHAGRELRSKKGVWEYLIRDIGTSEG
jgi:DNA repair protein RecO